MAISPPSRSAYSHFPVWSPAAPSPLCRREVGDDLPKTPRSPPSPNPPITAATATATFTPIILHGRGIGGRRRRAVRARRKPLRFSGFSFLVRASARQSRWCKMCVSRALRGGRGKEEPLAPSPWSCKQRRSPSAHLRCLMFDDSKCVATQNSSSRTGTARSPFAHARAGASQRAPTQHLRTVNHCVAIASVCVQLGLALWLSPSPSPPPSPLSPRIASPFSHCLARHDGQQCTSARLAPTAHAS